MVATARLLLLQVPPLTVLESVDEEPWHRVVVPEIAEGD
jgi:hypothetical protein